MKVLSNYIMDDSDLMTPLEVVKTLKYYFMMAIHGSIVIDLFVMSSNMSVVNTMSYGETYANHRAVT